MRKIILLFLVIGLFLISGCTEKAENNESAGNTAGVIEEVPMIVEQEPAEPAEEEVEETEPQEAVELKENIADKKNKFAITESGFEIERKTEKTLYFGVMNQKDESSDFTVEFFCDEAFDSAAKPETDIIFIYTEKIEGLKKDQIEVFPLVVKAAENAKPTDYKCKALIGPESYATKAFVIKVVNP